MKASPAYSDFAVNSNITGLPTYNLGLSESSVKQKYGLSGIVKLASNENPYGPSSTVNSALDEAFRSFNIYPDATAAELRTSLSNILLVDDDKIIVGNGSEELISIAARAFINEGDEMVTVTPDFGLHAIHAMSMGAHVRYINFNSDFSFDIDGIIEAVKQKPKMLCISSPSNPVGTYLRKQDIQSIARACGNHTIFLFDEAYYEYALSEPDYPDCMAILKEVGVNFLLLRTFSKAYGLAGLRIGYGVANSSNTIDNMHRVRNPFNVNAVAQIAAKSALTDSKHMMDCCRKAYQDRSIVFKALTNMGLLIAPSATNFLFVNTKHNADSLSEALQSRGVIVKPWSSLGYENFIRVSIGTPKENSYFLEAMRDVLREFKS